MNGKMAFDYCKKRLPVQVMRSAAGYYVGTCDDEGPVSRESCENWRKQSDADSALKDSNWTQLEV